MSVKPPPSFAAGIVLTPSPAVVARNAAGDVVSDVPVTFTVVEGGGTVAMQTVNTGQNGVAAVTWTLGRTVAENRLHATVGTLAPVVFVVKGIAGPPFQVYAVGGRQMTTGARAVPIGVVVVDQFDNPVADLPVTFTPLDGTTVRPVRSTTSDFGVANAHWAVPATPGEVHLRAAAPALEPLTFTATVVRPPPPCSPSGAVAVDGSPIQGALASGDCATVAGKRFRAYSLRLAGQTAFEAKLSSTAFDPIVAVHAGSINAEGDAVATNDDMADNDASAGVTVVAAAGDYVIRVEEFEPRTGPYSLTVSSASTDITGCASVFVVPNVRLDETLSNGDCDDDGSHADEIIVYLHQGQEIDVTMTSTAFAAKLDLEGELANNEFEITDDNSGGGTNSRLAFSAPVSDFYEIRATSALPGRTGTYVLTVERADAGARGSGGGSFTALLRRWMAKGASLWRRLHAAF